MMNEQMTIDFGSAQPLPARRRAKETLDSVIAEPARGGEPESVGTLMEPFRKIIAHPDRNRLMAEFFKRHW